MMNIFKKILPYKYKRSIKESLGVPSLHWSLQNLKKNNYRPVNVVDIGAYKGEWTQDFLEVFPHANVCMIEAQKTIECFLEIVKKRYPAVDYSIALLSSDDGIDKPFAENETASHVLKNHDEGSTVNLIRTSTLDTLLVEKKFPWPDFLKLDVQGHEIEVLKGAEKSFASAEICLLEVTLLDLGDNDPLLLEVLQFMDTKNFQAYDISQFMRRLLDKALYQLDVFFVKKNSALVSKKSWN